MNYENLYSESIAGNENALYELKTMACGGDARAQYVLSRVYENSNSPFRNVGLSQYWMTKSSENGYEAAKETLAESSTGDEAQHVEENKNAASYDSRNTIPYGIWSSKGRIDRTTFGVYLIIMVFVIGLILYCLNFIISPHSPEGKTVGLIIRLVVFYPCLMLTAKRAHDCSYTGWVAIVPFAPLFLLFKEGDHEDNKFGPASK